MPLNTNKITKCWSHPRSITANLLTTLWTKTHRNRDNLQYLVSRAKLLVEMVFTIQQPITATETYIRMVVVYSIETDFIPLIEHLMMVRPLMLYRDMLWNLFQTGASMKMISAGLKTELNLFWVLINSGRIWNSREDPHLDLGKGNLQWQPKTQATRSNHI